MKNKFGWLCSAFLAAMLVTKLAFAYPSCGISNNHYNWTGVGLDYDVTLTNFDSLSGGHPVSGFNTAHGVIDFDTNLDCPTTNELGFELGPKTTVANTFIVFSGKLPGHSNSCTLYSPAPDPCYFGVCFSNTGVVFNSYVLSDTAPNIGVVYLNQGVATFSPQPVGFPGGDENDCPSYLRGPLQLGMKSSCFRAPNGACSPVGGPPNSDLTWVPLAGTPNIHGGAGGAMIAP